VRAPYLHNGSVRTIGELLLPAKKRAKAFKIGSRVYDIKQMGFQNEGPFEFNTKISGNKNSGHEYGIHLSAVQKSELIEYLKTL